MDDKRPTEAYLGALAQQVVVCWVQGKLRIAEDALLFLYMTMAQQLADIISVDVWVHGVDVGKWALGRTSPPTRISSEGVA